MDYFSSTIDWCETNNVYSEHIVEYWNSISSLFISLCGIVGIYYYPNMTILYHSLIMIGIGSFYFHATLSLAGQLLDEYCILYCIIISIHYINYNIYNLIYTPYLLCINIIQILLTFNYPIYNRFILFMYGLYLYKAINIIKQKCIIVTYYVNVSQTLFIISLCCWVIDYICPYQYQMNLHAVWHILIGLVGFYSIKSVSAFLQLPVYSQ